MSAVALVGAVTTVLSKASLDKILLPLVSLAAGSLLGGAFFHMLPSAVGEIGALSCGVWLLLGFTVFLALEQFLHWHYSHGAAPDAPRPMTYLILLGDGLHNFLGGLGIASTFLIDARAGVVAWMAAVAHEIPQELGDFGILVHGGWDKRRALLWNLVSGLTFLAGALLAFFVSFVVEVAPLVAFGAGNFLYIGASDLVPEIKAQPSLHKALLLFASFAVGALGTYAFTFLPGG